MKPKGKKAKKQLIKLIAVNSFVWFAVHMGTAFVVTLLPVSLFDPESWIFRSKKWEDKGRLYERLFRVSKWKNLLPDGATWLIGGFAKKRLSMSNVTYIDRFVRETCRGELVHWLVTASTPIFLFWNTFSSFIIMIIYALAANMPCIIAQRYNRPRLSTLLGHMRSKTENQ